MWFRLTCLIMNSALCKRLRRSSVSCVIPHHKLTPYISPTRQDKASACLKGCQIGCDRKRVYCIVLVRIHTDNGEGPAATRSRVELPKRSPRGRGNDVTQNSGCISYGSEPLRFI